MVRTISVFFESNLVPDPGGRVRILAVPPVLREMMIYSGRWPIDRSSLSDPVADAVLHRIGGGWSPRLSTVKRRCSFPPRAIPCSRLLWTGPERTSTPPAWERSPITSASQSAHSADASRWDWACPGGMTHTGSPDPSATALLAEPGPSVLQVANVVGFEKPSSFNRAFRIRTGVTPSTYRKQRARHR